MSEQQSEVSVMIVAGGPPANEVEAQIDRPGLKDRIKRLIASGVLSPETPDAKTGMTIAADKLVKGGAEFLGYEIRKLIRRDIGNGLYEEHIFQVGVDDAHETDDRSVTRTERREFLRRVDDSGKLEIVMVLDGASTLPPLVVGRTLAASAVARLKK